MRILLVEDDEVLVDVLLKTLTHQHYVVDAVYDGQSGWEYAQTKNYELILIDVGLPGLDGITLCKRLRGEGYSVPILLMTARDAIGERIRGLDAGADDYLTKPLDLGELQARVRALLRRKEVSPSTIVRVGELCLDPNRCEVSYAGKPIKLTPKEYNLLELFIRNPQRVYNRTQIIDYLWSLDDDPPLEESVKAHIKGLRLKLKKAGAVDWIENVYGLGYRLNPKVNELSSLPTQSERETDDREQGSTIVPVREDTESHLKQSDENIEQQYHNFVDRTWYQYQDVMAQRLGVLQTAVKAIEKGDITEELRNSAVKEAHKLAGVLGMFERETGTLIAREIEHLLSQPDSLNRHQLLSLVQELHEILALPVSNLNQSDDNARLLLINTSIQFGQELSQLSQPLGIGRHQVTNIAEATEWLKHRSPDVVVLNVNGATQWQESLALIRDLTATVPSIPVIVVTASDSLEDRLNVAQAGGCSFLVEPIKASQVWDTVNRILRRYRWSAVHVLVVDDDPIFLSTLRPLLEPWGIRMTGLENPHIFWDVLNSCNPDLLILDVEMPSIGGIELCQAVRTDPHWQELPIFFLTSHRDQKIIQRIFAAGADDYITKPVIGAELLTRISNRLERNRLLKNLSTQDSQTGISNYTQSLKDLDDLLSEYRDNQGVASLAILKVAELDKLKWKYGLDISNLVLHKWGRLIQSVFRGGEVLGYWGDGEFIIGVPGLNSVQASERLGEILSVLRQQIFTAPDSSRFQVLCNWAVVEYPTHGETIHSLYQKGIKLIKNKEQQNTENALAREVERYALLNEITQKIRNNLDSEQIFQTTVNQVGTIFGVSRCHIHSYITFPQPEIPIVAEYKLSNYPSMLEAKVPIDGNPYAKKVLAQDAAVAVVDVCVEPLVQPVQDICFQLQVKSLLAVRTSYQGQANGILVLQQCENIRDWTNEEIELLEAVAAQVGIALAQARLLEQETQNRKLLQEAKNKVEVANHAKSIFLTNISHELLTPLNAILGFSQLMVQDLNLNFQQQDQLTIINRSGERLLNLIKDVLEMSKIEAGKTFLNPLPFDLHHLLYQLWQTFEPQAKLKHLLLQFNLAPDLPLYIVGDESKLRQVLTNLLSNAIKFTDAGSVIMDVESRELGIGTRILPLQVSPSPFVLRVARTPSERVSDAKVQHTNGLPVASVEENTTKWPHQQLLFAPHSLFFSIKDTGRGIAPEERENIFQPFVQAVSTNQAEGGTGLGLAISHKFVQLMGGNLQVISTVGDGSTFYFDINVTLAGSTRIKDCVGKARLLYTNDLPSDLVNNSLQIMPVQWIADLHQAAIEADGDTILRLVEQIPHAQANLAVELTQLTHLYDFDAIIELSRGKP